MVYSSAEAACCASLTECLSNLNGVIDTLCHAEPLHRDVPVFHHLLAVILMKVQPSYL